MQISSTIPQISIIIPCYKQPRELNNCLLALRNQKCALDYGILVVDSEPCSSVVDIAGNFSEVKLIRGAKNLKPGSARNLGVENSKSKYIAFLDSDCIPHKYWLQAAFDSLEQGYKLVGGPIVDQLPNHPVSYVDNLLQFVDYSANRPSGIAKHIPASNSAVQKSVFDTVGKFPEIDLIAGEDVLFSQKIAEKYPADIWFNSNMIVSHLGRKDFKVFLDHQISFGYTRGYNKLLLKESYRRISRYRFMILAIVLKRFEYIFRKSLIYNPVLIFRNLIYCPLIFIGLYYWATGFQKGCEAGIKNTSVNK